MRSIWKGAISFGLVTIPVKLYSATEEKDVAFHQVRRTDGSRVKYKRVAAVDGEEVGYGDIAKGFELPSGEVVVLTDDDLASLPLTSSRAIEVLEFVPLEQVDPIYFAKSYYLEPDKTGTKPYVLLRDALERSGRVALVKIALRQREALATLRVRDGVFVLETMLWPDEIRRPDFGFLEEPVEVRPQELAMATSLIDSLAGDFDPSQYSDAYREALTALIDAKIEGREVIAPAGESGDTAAVLDLMAALQASVDAARAGRAAQSGAAGSAASGESAAGSRAAKAPAKPAKSRSATPAAAGSAASPPGKRTAAAKAAASGATGPTAVPAAAAEAGGEAGEGAAPAKAARARRVRKSA